MSHGQKRLARDVGEERVVSANVSACVCVCGGGGGGGSSSTGYKTGNRLQ